MTFLQRGASSYQIMLPCDLGRDVGENCFFDTGARLSSLRANADLALYAAGEPEHTMGAAGVLIQQNTRVVESLSVGELRAGDLKLTETAPGAARADVAHIGSDFLLAATAPGQSVVFNFDANTLTESSEPLAAPQQIEFIMGALMGLHVSASGTDILALFDTGAYTTVIDRDFYLAHPGLFVSTGNGTTIHDAQGRGAAALSATITSLTIGPRTFANVPAIVLDLSALRARFGKPMTMILGLDLIRQNNWMFNLHSAQWSMTARNQ